jgi:hypothetical protein
LDVRHPLSRWDWSDDDELLCLRMMAVEEDELDEDGLEDEDEDEVDATMLLGWISLLFRMRWRWRIPMRLLVFAS